VTGTVDMPMNGVHVLVTRPQQQSGALCAMIEGAGGTALSRPVLEIEAAPDGAAALAGQRSGIVIFISRNAVQYAFALHPALGADLGAARAVVIAAGAATRAALRERGFTDVFAPATGGGSEAVLALAQLQTPRVKDENVLIVRGVGGRELLREELDRRGAAVRYAEVYRRKRPAPDPDAWTQMWREDRPAIIVITSVQGLHNLVELTPAACRPALLDTPLAAISARVCDAAAAHGFRRIGVAQSESDAALFETMKEIVREQKHG
jgi:uroporphyrinogen-III synthase